MARQGINKQMVQKAKNELLTHGQRPTIDAVRIALGNTGSKTTIARYLKELEEPPKPTLDRLSKPLVRLIHGLSEQLQDEAEERLIKAQTQFSREKTQLLLQLARAQTDLEQLERKIKNLEIRLQNEQQQLRAEIAKTIQQAEELVNAQRKFEELARLLQKKHTQPALHTMEQTANARNV